MDTSTTSSLCDRNLLLICRFHVCEMKGNTLTPSHLGYSSIWWVQEGTRNSCTFWNIPMTPCLTSWSSNHAAIFALSRPVSMSGVSLATSSLPWTDVESNASDFICFQIWTVLFVWELCFPKCSPPPYGSFPWLVPHQASRFSAYAFLLSFSKCKVDHGDAQSLLIGLLVPTPLVTIKLEFCAPSAAQHQHPWGLDRYRTLDVVKPC